ncbi:MAG: M20/M25/M40 family metallo-hydrolase [bacterium]|nr:M20/M25/M40 family metallo-hydrolase [bacterium]
MQELYETLVDWIEIPSVTGDETDYGDALARALAAHGFDVELQEVSPRRFNVLARAGRPEVVFCTHLDTVPPYFGSRTDADFIHGRGSCDAKGQAAAMLFAGAELLRQGEDRIGFLFTVGEETTSDGAAHADAHLAEPWAPRNVIIGEPTDSAFVASHKGIYKVRLVAHGVAGHSSQDVGPSAIHELVASTGRLIEAGWGEHPVFGKGTVNVGQIGGGVAANVVAEQAEADVLIRSVEPPEVVEERLASCLSKHVEIDHDFKNFAPVAFHVPAGEAAESVAFGTDAPHMPRWGQPLLYGAGSILDAHTDHEKVSKRDLALCVERHVRTVHELLAR